MEDGRGAAGARIAAPSDGGGTSGACVGGAGGGVGCGAGGRVVDVRVVGYGVWCGVGCEGARGAVASGGSATAAAGGAEWGAAANPWSAPVPIRG